MTKKFYPITICTLSESDGGGFMAFAADLPGCASDGDTQEEALMNLQDAIDAWCEEAIRLGRTIPEPGAFAKARRKDIASLLDIIRKQRADLVQMQQELTNLAIEQDDPQDCGVMCYNQQFAH